MSQAITVLYFYRTRWGAHDEFVALFRKNHWPVLREQLADGRFTAVEMSTPRFHGDGRADWDVLVSITFRDWAADHSVEFEVADPDFRVFRKVVWRGCLVFWERRPSAHEGRRETASDEE